MPRVAIIGASHWHLGLFLPTLREMSNVDLVGVADPHGDRAASLGDELGCPASASYRRLCDEVTPDFVLALGIHRDMADEADYLIDRRIAFAMEKPCGIDAAAVRGLATRAESERAFAAVPFVWRQSELRELMRQRFDDSDVDYLSLRWIAGPPARYLESGCEWMLDPAQSGGGCTINLSVHLIDLARQVFGDSIEVAAATMSNAAYRLDVEDYSVIALRDGERTALVETGYLLPGPHSNFDMRFSIKAREHYLIATGPEDVEIVDARGRREHVTVRTTNVPHYPVFVRDVIRRFECGEPPLASLSDMAAVMELAQRAYAMAGRRKGKQWSSEAADCCW